MLSKNFLVAGVFAGILGCSDKNQNDEGSINNQPDSIQITQSTIQKTHSILEGGFLFSQNIDSTLEVPKNFFEELNRDYKEDNVFDGADARYERILKKIKEIYNFFLKNDKDFFEFLQKIDIPSFVHDEEKLDYIINEYAITKGYVFMYRGYPKDQFFYKIKSKKDIFVGKGSSLDILFGIKQGKFELLVIDSYKFGGRNLYNYPVVSNFYESNEEVIMNEILHVFMTRFGYGSTLKEDHDQNILFENKKVMLKHLEEFLSNVSTLITLLKNNNYEKNMGLLETDIEFGLIAHYGVLVGYLKNDKISSEGYGYNWMYAREIFYKYAGEDLIQLLQKTYKNMLRVRNEMKNMDIHELISYVNQLDFLDSTKKDYYINQLNTGLSNDELSDLKDSIILNDLEDIVMKFMEELTPTQKKQIIQDYIEHGKKIAQFFIDKKNKKLQ